MVFVITKFIKLGEQKNKCFHADVYKYVDEDNNLHCEKCEKEYKK